MARYSIFLLVIVATFVPPLDLNASPPYLRGRRGGVWYSTYHHRPYYYRRYHYAPYRIIPIRPHSFWRR